MSADLHAEIKQTVNSIIEEKMEGIATMSDLNNSTRVYDKLDEISNKLSLLVNELSQLNLQTVTVNNLTTTNTQYQPQYIPMVEVPKSSSKTKSKPDAIFIPTIDSSNIEMVNKNKKSVELSGDDFLNTLNALDKLK
jgi:hypothetical protein